MSKCVVTEPSSFKEAMEDPVWVDAMVKSMILLLEIVHGRLFLDQKGNQWWVRDVSTKLSRQLTGVWRSTRQDLLPEAFHR